MSKEIAEAIDRALNPLGVGVIIEAAHMVSKHRNCCLIEYKFQFDLKINFNHCYSIDIELFFNSRFLFSSSFLVHGDERKVLKKLEF